MVREFTTFNLSLEQKTSETFHLKFSSVWEIGKIGDEELILIDFHRFIKRVKHKCRIEYYIKSLTAEEDALRRRCFVKKLQASSQTKKQLSKQTKNSNNNRCIRLLL